MLFLCVCVHVLSMPFFNYITCFCNPSFHLPYLTPIHRAQYTVLVPALWNTEVQDWELKCMNSLVLDETHHEPKAGKQCMHTHKEVDLKQKLIMQRDTGDHSAHSHSNSGSSFKPTSLNLQWHTCISCYTRTHTHFCSLLMSMCMAVGPWGGHLQLVPENTVTKGGNSHSLFNFSLIFSC